MILPTLFTALLALPPSVAFPGDIYTFEDIAKNLSSYGVAVRCASELDRRAAYISLKERSWEKQKPLLERALGVKFSAVGNGWQVDPDPTVGKEESTLWRAYVNAYDAKVGDTCRMAVDVFNRLAAEKAQGANGLLNEVQSYSGKGPGDITKQAYDLALAIFAEKIDPDIFSLVASKMRTADLVQDQTVRRASLYEVFRTASPTWKERFNPYLQSLLRMDGPGSSFERSLGQRTVVDRFALDIARGYLCHSQAIYPLNKTEAGKSSILNIVPAYIRPQIRRTDLGEAEALGQRQRTTTNLASNPALGGTLDSRLDRISLVAASWAKKSNQDLIVEISPYFDQAPESRDNETFGEFLAVIGNAGRQTPEAPSLRETGVEIEGTARRAALSSAGQWTAELVDQVLILHNECTFLDRICPTDAVLSREIDRASITGGRPTLEALSKPLLALDWKSLKAPIFSSNFYLAGDPAKIAPVLWLYENEKTVRGALDNLGNGQTTLVAASSWPQPTVQGLGRWIAICAQSALFYGTSRGGPLPPLASDFGGVLSQSSLQIKRTDGRLGTTYDVTLLTPQKRVLWTANLGPVSAEKR